MNSAVSFSPDSIENDLKYKVLYGSRIIITKLIFASINNLFIFPYLTKANFLIKCGHFSAEVEKEITYYYLFLLIKKLILVSFEKIVDVRNKIPSRDNIV